MPNTVLTKHWILIFGFFLIFMCIVLTSVMVSHAGHLFTAFTPDVQNSHYIMSRFTAFTPDIMNGHYILNGHI